MIKCGQYSSEDHPHRGRGQGQGLLRRVTRDAAATVLRLPLLLPLWPHSEPTEPTASHLLACTRSGILSSTARRTISHTLGFASPAAAKGLGGSNAGRTAQGVTRPPGHQTRGRRPLGPIQALIGSGTCQMGSGEPHKQAICTRAFCVLRKEKCFVKPSTSLSQPC